MATIAKKNLIGGKAHKRMAGKERSNDRKNREITEGFIDDIKSGADIGDLKLARVDRVLGGLRMSLLTCEGKTIIAGLKGSLKCSKGAARRCDNPLSVMVGTFVILQEESYGVQIAGVLARAQVAAIEPYYKSVPKGFFDIATAEEDAGFEWDVGEEEELDIEKI
jgi:hypothetical protein